METERSNIPENELEIDAEDVFQEYRRELNEEELNIVVAADESASSFLRQYGHEADKDLKKTFYILEAEGFRKLGKEESGAVFHPKTEAIYINESFAGSRLRLLQRAEHELIHYYTMPRDSEKLNAIQQYGEINEGLTSLMEREVFADCLRKNDYFQQEVAETEMLKQEYPDVFAKELKEKVISEADVLCVKKYDIPDHPGYFTFDVRSFPYIQEYRLVIGFIMDISKNTNDQEKIKRLMIENVPRGNFDDLERILDEEYGEGTFARLESRVQTHRAMRNCVQILKEYF